MLEYCTLACNDYHPISNKKHALVLKCLFDSLFNFAHILPDAYPYKRVETKLTDIVTVNVRTLFEPQPSVFAR